MASESGGVAVWKILLAVSLVLLLTAAISGAVLAKPPAKCDPWPQCKNGDEEPAPTLDIAAFNFGYSPATLITTAVTITVGVDGGKHTFTSADGIFDSGPLRGGQTYDITGLDPGNYPYFCTIHGADKMSGLIIQQ